MSFKIQIMFTENISPLKQQIKQRVDRLECEYII